MSINVPTFQISDNELQNLPNYLYKHEKILKEFGAIKIQLDNTCKLALKKRRKKLFTYEINEQIIKINSTDLIYTVENCDKINQSDKKGLLAKDENDFWSQLSSLNKQQLNTSSLSNKSFFYRRISRIYFDIHRIPCQSILKIGGKQITNQFIPCIKRAYRAGAIFPLKSTRQHLFSVDYHHEGGNHHWYIIPHNQREHLQTIINSENPSVCLDHQQIFVHPSLFEKNHIRYHKIIQCPNEFVILSSGTLFQSYTENSSWSESIDFALPIWITQGYGYNSNLLCKCHSYSSRLIDMNLFSHDLVQKYIQSLPKSIINNKSNLLKDNVIRSENLKVVLSRQEIFSYNQSSSNNHISRNNQDNNIQIPYQSLEQNNVGYLFEQKTSDTVVVDSILSKYLSELEEDLRESCQMTTVSSSIDQDLITSFDEDNEFLSHEELMDTPPAVVNSVESQINQINKHQNTSNLSTILFNPSSTNIKRKRHMKRKRIFDRSNHDRKTLFVSRLKHDVDTNDIYNHFIGCVKVTIKQYHTASHLKYAFVLHRTSEEAESNLRRSINFHLLGPKCHVQYAGKSSSLTNNQQKTRKAKIVIRQIPQNITENDLRHIFLHGHIIKYYPARVISSESMISKSKNNDNILLG